jgi:hypothetical protein
MSLPGAGLKAAGEKEQLGAAKDELDRIEDERSRSLGLVEGLDWTPERVSAALGSYQRSKSPVADAWMQSMLTGDNPDAIADTRAGAKRQKAQAQQRFDATTGGWDKIRAEQAEMEKSQPWQLKDVAEAGPADPAQEKALKEAGLNIRGGQPDKDTAKQLKFWVKGIGDLSARGGKGQQFMQALSSYLQQGGSWKALTEDKLNLGKKAGDQRIDVDEFIAKYRPQGAVSLARPAPSPPARA